MGSYQGEVNVLANAGALRKKGRMLGKEKTQRGAVAMAAGVKKK